MTRRLRWRHSGFKEMYREELKGDQSKDDSSVSGKSRSRSPVARPRSPKRPRSPPARHERRPRPRSPPSPPRKSGSRDKSRGRPRTPTHRRSRSRQQSESYSSSDSGSSSPTCSDDSCSVCSPNHKGRHSPPSPASPPPKKKQAVRKVVKHPPPRKSPPPKDTRKKKIVRPKSPPHPRTPESSSGSSSSSSESESSSEDTSEQPKLSLSERFGKMAQWSVDRREYDTVKMKITKDASNSGMKVVIENDPDNPEPYARPVPVVKNPSPERDYAFHYERRRYFFERTFSHDRPVGLDVPINWGDPVNRYTYYRTKSLLWEPEVSFDEYIKWETWWERFQEWLEVERAYYGEDMALDNARRERERDWESYRTSSMGRANFDRDLLPLPRNQPWNRNLGIRGRIGGPRRKFVRP
ncbi:hypothetical protein B566_EDAN005980 [Ephemera danica]|nr:hypothetical protein B566_EDAN005980 [Ephemera danica]